MRVIVLLGAVILLSHASPVTAAPRDAIVVCTEHLEAIGRALTAYRRDKGDWPAHLSDLYPRYIADRAVFHCPADTSAGSNGLNVLDDPGLPTSYRYLMVPVKIPQYLFTRLGPEPPMPNTTLRDSVLDQHVHFGDRAIIAECHQHERAGTTLRVTWGGQIYRDGGWPYTAAWMVTGMVQQLENDLTEGTPSLAHNWSWPAVEDYASDWINAALPPALRYRLGVAADRLSTVAKAQPPSSQRDADRLAARFFSAAGKTTRAISAAEAALRLARGPSDRRSSSEKSTSPPDEQAIPAGLLAELRYRASGEQGTPPLDEYLSAERARQHIPGLSVSVVREGKLLLAKGYGLANVERSVPATRDTVYGIASMTKSFTATGIMMLVEQGKIGLDEPISRYLPDTPPAWAAITVRHLLTHTSGLLDWWNELPQDGRPKLDPPDEFIRGMGGLPVKFPPGEQWSYSSTGYLLLGWVIERVTGKPLEVFLDERIFRPLQMNWTARDFLDLNILSTGYAWEQDKRLRINAWHRDGVGRFDRMWGYGPGGFVSTVTDLAKWDAALYTEKLLMKSSLGQMWTPARLKDGSPAPAWGHGYGFGWMLWGTPGRRIITHGGNAPGASSVMMRYVDDKLTVILLMNRDGIDQFGLASGVARFYLPIPKPIEPPDTTTTRRLKAVLLQLVDGKAAATLFTREAQAALLPDMLRTSAFYRSLGPLQSFYLVERTSNGGNQTYRCRAVFGNTPWIQTFTLINTGKVAEVGIEPE